MTLTLAATAAIRLAGVVGLRCVDRRQAVVFGLEGRDEFLVLGVVEIGRPRRGVLGAERGVADRAEHVLAEGEAGAHHRDFDARLRILLHEGDAHAAGQEEEDGIGTRRADLRDLGGIVGLAELGVDLADQLALVVALEAVQRIRAGRIVRREDEDLLDALGLA